MFVSYAQAGEDILLHRALSGVHHETGFYIDAGACHPDMDSVTKHFYNHGWRGINIEPSLRAVPWFQQARPRDINLQVAVTEFPGEITFHELDNGQLSTVVEKFVDRHQESSGYSCSSYTVPAMTLTQICEQHAPRDIHFLKIDIEGAEGAAIRGMDFHRFRPWVLCIEATEPMRLDLPTYEEWDSHVQASGYRFAYTDVLNRYYVANEHSALITRFSVGIDHFVHARYVQRISDLERRLNELAPQVDFQSQGNAAA